jgi:guanylate kinase
LRFPYFELPKLPEVISADDELKLWLALSKTDTEEGLRQIETLGAQVMQETIKTYRSITVTPEFLEAERLRLKARHDEAQALFHARQEAARKADKKWQSVVAEKDAILAEKNAENAWLSEQIAVLEARLGEQK